MLCLRRHRFLTILCSDRQHSRTAHPHGDSASQPHPKLTAIPKRRNSQPNNKLRILDRRNQSSRHGWCYSHFNGAKALFFSLTDCVGRRAAASLGALQPRQRGPGKKHQQPLQA